MICVVPGTEEETLSQLAERVRWMKPSPTLEINTRARQLRAEGVDVLKFAAGEPDVATPAHAREAARQAIEDGYTRYTAVAGDPDLRGEVSDQFSKSRGVEVDPDQVIIGYRAKQIIAYFLHAVLEKHLTSRTRALR